LALLTFGLALNFGAAALANGALAISVMLFADPPEQEEKRYQCCGTREIQHQLWERLEIVHRFARKTVETRGSTPLMDSEKGRLARPPPAR
jgi:hypothetical protein